ncbi:MAG: phosphoribosylformylglycinamidine cyclo-ligase [Caldicoprobacter sp.]|uniref:phosphoribosylformylglycinamidine cyclo-ligase n=1 Tax=Caldicoprobacter sp. TaxID=2004500 RepID=UPI001DF67EDF|nr:phosphoribosylformylglycinamidine cyclo-ligase [Clostridia bacterium]
MGYTYKDAGVDVEAGYTAVRLMKEFIKKTYDRNVIGDIGGFGGLYSLDLKDMKQPVLVAGADGVGTKLQLAFIMDKHDTVGQDCVAMCVNDVVCQGAKPLFFLDYIATGRLKPEKVAQIVKGVADGCMQAGCALIGGETAEMPGFYKDEEYDIAGFAVGMVDRSKIIDGSNIQEGDVLIGLASSGVHSNGYSLVRRLVLHDKYRLEEKYDALGCTVGEELLKPTRIYVKGVLGVLKRFKVKGIAHITGGGFIENVPRILPEGLVAQIQLGSWPVLPIFELIKRWGDIEDRDMFNTFNMGIGMVLVCSPQDVDGIIAQLKSDGYPSYIIGRVIKGYGGVVFIQ